MFRNRPSWHHLHTVYCTTVKQLSSYLTVAMDVLNAFSSGGIRGGGDSTSSGRDGDGAGPAKGRKVSHASVGDVDTLEGQRAVLDALIQETEKAREMFHLYFMFSLEHSNIM